MGKSNNRVKSQNSVNKTELKCRHCSKEFKYDSERKRHEQSHSPQFACKVCSKKFSFMSALRRHEKQHERTGSVNCNKCNRKFRDDSLLKRHLQYAHKGTFICKICNTVYSSDLALRSHMKTHNTESERRYRCSFEGCIKSFNFAHHLRHHELTHTNTKQHFCVICEKGFIQYHHLKSHLKRHMDTHHLCLKCSTPTCLKTFTSVRDLKEHLKTHKNNNTDNKISDAESHYGISITNIVSEYDNNGEDTTSDTNFPESDIVRGDYSDLDLQELNLQSKCSLIEVNIDDACDLSKRETNDDAQSPKADTFEAVEPTPVSICNSYIGECIMENDANGNQKCVCAQISCPIEDTYDFVSKKILNTSKTSKINNVKVQRANPICANCICDSKKLNCGSNESFMDSLNKNDNVIEYKADGTIRIKDAFDIDLDVSIKASDNIIKKEIKPETIPFNSCKAVLGTCIVSGNGTIGEGCLCAKMAVDDQPMIEQEIDELTPCPKMN